MRRWDSGRGSPCGACKEGALLLGWLPLPPSCPFVSTILGGSGKTLHTPKEAESWNFYNSPGRVPDVLCGERDSQGTAGAGARFGQGQGPGWSCRGWGL